MNITAFYDASRAVATQASHIGLDVPGFRGRWGLAAHRMLGRYGSGRATVFVDLNRSDDEIIDALIDGTLVCNGRTLDDPCRVDLDPRQPPLPF